MQDFVMKDGQHEDITDTRVTRELIQGKKLEKIDECMRNS